VRSRGGNTAAVAGILPKLTAEPGRSLMTPRSPDSGANLTRSASPAGSPVALALSGRRPPSPTAPGESGVDALEAPARERLRQSGRHGMPIW